MKFTVNMLLTCIIYIVTPGNTDNAVNRLARKQLHLHHVVSERTKGGIKQYIELEKHNLDQIYANNIRTSLDKRIAFSK